MLVVRKRGTEAFMQPGGKRDAGEERSGRAGARDQRGARLPDGAGLCASARAVQQRRRERAGMAGAGQCLCGEGGWRDRAPRPRSPKRFGSIQLRLEAIVFPGAIERVIIAALPTPQLTALSIMTGSTTFHLGDAIADRPASHAGKSFVWFR